MVTVMEDKVPVRTALSDLYPQDALLQQGERWNKLAEKFVALYGRKPEFIARSPGRVAIIGEHVDYSLYPVMPMGIAADVIIAVATSPSNSGSGSIKLHNLEDEKYKPDEFAQSAESEVVIDASNHSWTNYFKAGLAGALPMLKRVDPGLKVKNLELLVHGTVPAGGGVSSSAAFVSTSALAVSYAHNHLPVKKELTELAIVSERNVGVNSGGMDQAGSILSLRNEALYVDFYPSLHAVAVPFPKTSSHPMTFLVAQSYVVSNKAETGPIHYNLRVVEVSLAAVFIAAQLGLPPLPKDASPLGASLRGLEDTLFKSDKAPKDIDASDAKQRLKYMLTLLDKYLPDTQGYTREAISSATNLSIEQLESQYISAKFSVRATHFKLRQRAKHVLTESLRVLDFIELMRSKPASPNAEEKVLE